jgi:hypothetical protein
MYTILLVPGQEIVIFFQFITGRLISAMEKTWSKHRILAQMTVIVTKGSYTVKLCDAAFVIKEDALHGSC